MTKPVDLEELKRLLAVATRGQDGGYFLTVITPALIAELEAAREGWERECQDGDRILALFPHLQRTESGWFPVAKIINEIEDIAARCKCSKCEHEVTEWKIKTKCWQQIADQRAIEVADLQVANKRLLATKEWFATCRPFLDDVTRKNLDAFLKEFA